MKTLVFALIVLAQVGWGLVEASERELLEPAEVARLFDREVGRLNFAPVARYTHPDCLRDYRATTMRIIDKCIAKYGIEVVQAVLELGEDRPKLESYSDEEFFVYVLDCTMLMEDSEERGGIELLGEFERDGSLYVTYKRSVFLEEVPVDGQLYGVATLEFQRVGEQWMKRGMPYRHTEKALGLLCAFEAGDFGSVK